MTIQEGDRMQIGEKWYVVVRTERRLDCKRCALRPMNKKNCTQFCECVDYRFDKAKYYRWEEYVKPIIPNKK